MGHQSANHHESDSLADIKSLIPHRDPFLFVDALESWEGGKVVGTRLFKDTDFFFKGHFPGYPVVPGVVLIEALAQCGGAGLLKRGVLPQHAIIFLAAVHGARFRRPVRPGDLLRMEIEDVRVTSKMMRQKGQGWVEGILAVEAEWMAVSGEAK